MLGDMEEVLSRLSAHERDAAADDIRQAARALLERQFVFGDDFQGRRRYETVRRFKGYFADLFDGFGFDLVFDEREQLAGIVNRQGATMRRMHVDETVFLVALRVVYEQRVRDYMLGEHGRALTNMAEVWSLIEERTHRVRPAITRCRAIADSLARNGIVRMLPPSPDGDAPIEIRPVIARVVTVASAETLERWARSEGMARTAAEAGDEAA
jgi:hypothetical protein